MYIKCERIHKAHKLFDNMHDANIVSWFAMIARYAKNGFSKKIPKTIKGLLTFTTEIIINIKLGVWKCVHGACNFNILVLNSLIDMYIKCERVHKVQELFDKMHDANIVS